jgi:hypothetical protein
MKDQIAGLNLDDDAFLKLVIQELAGEEVTEEEWVYLSSPAQAGRWKDLLVETKRGIITSITAEKAKITELFATDGSKSRRYWQASRDFAVWRAKAVQRLQDVEDRLGDIKAAARRQEVVKNAPAEFEDMLHDIVARLARIEGKIEQFQTPIYHLTVGEAHGTERTVKPGG